MRAIRAPRGLSTVVGKKPKGKRSARAIFFDRGGFPLSSHRYRELQDDHSYRYLRRFRNDHLEIVAEWHGVVSDADRSPREYWKLFRVLYKTLIPSDDPISEEPGRWVSDPILSKSFVTAFEAIEYFERVLADPDNQWALEEDTQPIADKVSAETIQINSTAGSW